VFRAIQAEQVMDDEGDSDPAEARSKAANNPVDFFAVLLTRAL